MKPLVLSLFAISLLAQTSPAPVAPQAALPTYIGGGLAVNQLGTSRWNLWGTAIYQMPVVSSGAGMYMSSTADIFPVKVYDPNTGRKFYAASTSLRQGAHKILIGGPSAKFTVLVGADAGLGISQSLAGTGGMAFNFSGGVEITAVYQFSQKLAAVLPVRAIYMPVPGATTVFNVVPQIGLLLRP